MPVRSLSSCSTGTPNPQVSPSSGGNGFAVRRKRGQRQQTPIDVLLRKNRSKIQPVNEKRQPPLAERIQRRLSGGGEHRLAVQKRAQRIQRRLLPFS